MAFKEVFMKESNKDILKALLESILKVEIEEIEYLNLEKNQDNINIKRKHFDLHLKTNIGSIQVEVNGGIKPYTRNRNTAYICDTYSHEVLVGEEYLEDRLIIQINFTYGLGKDEKSLRIYKLMDEEMHEYVSNLLIYEFNMDYYEKVWYSKDERKIEEYKYIIMQNLKLEDLEKLSKKDKVVDKFMSELERVNENPKFREYMSAEEDNRKIENTMKRFWKEEARQEGLEEGRKEGRKEGIKKGREEGREEARLDAATNLIKNGVSLEVISKSLGISIEELKKIKLN